MKSIQVKEFKAYQSVRFGRNMVNHFHTSGANAVKQYLKNIRMDFIPELNSIFVRGPAGQTLVNMSNVSDWVPVEIDSIEKELKPVVIKKEVAKPKTSKTQSIKD